MKKKKIPIGVRRNGRLINFSLTHQIYPSVDWNEHGVCWFLMCCMLAQEWLGASAAHLTNCLAHKMRPAQQLQQ